MSRRKNHRMARTARMLALALTVTALGSVTIVYLRWLYREQRYNRLIEEVSARHAVDKFLIKAMIRRESKFDPFSYGTHGEIGLMQVTEAAGLDWARATGRKDFGRDALWDARVNVEAGTWYLWRALRRWQNMDDRVPFALAEYNAGLGNVQRWLPAGQATTAEQFMEAITFPGVRRYVEAVMDYRAAYEAAGRL